MDCVCLQRKAPAQEQDANQAGNRTSMPKVGPSRPSAAASGSQSPRPASAFLIRQPIRQAPALYERDGRSLLLQGFGTTEPAGCGE